jgi:hypothetical protein
MSLKLYEKTKTLINVSAGLPQMTLKGTWLRNGRTRLVVTQRLATACCSCTLCAAAAHSCHDKDKVVCAVHPQKAAAVWH